MIIVIRTDASTAIGTGHVMRCLTLAGVLQEKGASVSFICREHEGHLCDLIEERGFVIHRLCRGADPVSPSPAFNPYHAPWLGASWEEDAEETAQIISEMNTKSDWLIVDHYALDERWEKHLRPYVDRIFVIDDLADRVHDCDVLVNHTLLAHSINFSMLVPNTCKLLLGVNYIMLHKIYSELHNKVIPRKGMINRILIYFGGSDRDDLTGRTLKAILKIDHRNINFDIVLPNNYSFIKELTEQIKEFHNFHIHNRLQTLAPLMIQADLAIGGGGMTLWERICLGLPTIVITLAKNQQSQIFEFERLGLVQWLGDKSQVTIKMIQKEMENFINKGLDEEWSIKCLKTVDGKGLDRICSVLIQNKYEFIH